MPRYVLLMGEADVDKRAGNAVLTKELYEQYTSWLSSIRQAGHKVQSHALKDQSGARLSVRGGQVVEGPFMETKEAVGGIVFVEAASLEEATAIARRCPALLLQNCTIEVRAVLDVGRPAV